jgi:hypothetical protein
VTTSDLLSALRARGVRLSLSFTAEGMTPTVGGKLTDADRAALAERREELISALLSEARAAAAARERRCGADGAAVGRAIGWDGRRKETR